MKNLLEEIHNIQPLTSDELRGLKDEMDSKSRRANFETDEIMKELENKINNSLYKKNSFRL